MQKIGILGGSFDPIHMGHLNIAESARAEFDLDEVWFIPAGHSPNKDEREMTSAEMRAGMTARAIADHAYFKLSRIELNSAGTSYTYLTLTRLKEQYPAVEFYFIMGADSLDYFDSWYHPEIICEKAVILTAVRDDMDAAQVLEKIADIKALFPARIYPLRGGRTDISSTEVRKSIRSGEPLNSMLPLPVWQYIREHGLYGYNVDR